MYRLSTRNKAILAKKIRYYKDLHFPGKGSGIRLADEVGVPPQAISNWLNGSRQPTAIQLYRLAIAFNVSPLELCGFPKGKAPAAKSAEISILHDILTMMREAKKRNANPHITAKAMNEFNSLLEHGIAEILKRKKRLKA